MNEVLDACEREGLSRSELVEDIYGLDVSLVEVTAARRIWWRAAGATRDPLFGAKVGRALSPRATHVLAPIRWHSRTFGDALKHLLRYQALLSESGQFTSSTAEDGSVRLAYRASESPLAIHPMQIDSVISAFIAGGPPPLGIELAERSEGDAEAFALYLGCPVALSRRGAAITYSAGDLARTVAGADSGLCAVNLAYAEEMLERKLRGQELRTRVNASLDRLGVSATMTVVATEVGLSPRTLQRRLATFGTSFKMLAQARRMEQALLLLTQTGAAIEMISDLLGYSDASAFSRAVSSWWGQGPRALRRLKGQRA